MLTVGLALTSSLAGAQTITQPAAQTNVPAAWDWATRTYQDPINMAERTDIGWWNYSKDQPASNLNNIQVAGNHFSATAASNDPNITILDSALPAGIAVPRVRTGSATAIDAGLYRTLAIRMRLSGASQGVRASDGQIMWTSKSIYESPTSVAGSFPTYGGWQIYLIDIPSLGLATGQGWQGLIRWLRLDPTTVTGSTIDIDWIRLVNTSDTSTFRTITWSGATAVDIYLDNDRVESNGTLGMIAKNSSSISRSVSGGSYQFQPGAMPAGDYYVGMRRSGTADALKYSAGFYRVAGTPTLTFTSPSPLGSADDFATTVLGNPWDLTSMSDVDMYNNATGVGIAAVAAETAAGVSLGTVSALKGTSLAAGAIADPYVHLLFDQKRGASKPIDTNKYRILSFDVALPGARDMNNGSVARVVWKARGESSYNVSEDIVVNHRAGATVFDNIVVDLKALPLEAGAGSPSHTGWHGLVDSFRLDPHEFTPATTFYLRNVRLAALERSGSSYAIRWSYDDAGSDSTLSLFVDDDGQGFDGGALAQGLDPATGRYTWNTAGLVAGREYFIYARLIRPDGSIANQGYAPWPIVGGASSGGTVPPPPPAPAGPPNPVMSLDLPGANAVLTQPAIVAGWAADLGAASGSGIDAVHVWAYPATGAAPIFAGAAQYGGARPDVGAVYGARFAASGFGLQVNGLPPGGYQLVAFAHSKVSGTFNITRAVNVTFVGRQADPRMAIDTPASGQAVGSSFVVAGWAIDLGSPSGSGVDAVHVWAYPAGGGAPFFLGVAPHGGARPDVAAAFGARATASGYGMTASGVKPGVYDVVVYAHSSVTGTFNNSQAVRITVR